MDQLTIAILCLSIVLQIVAVVAAFRLGKGTRRWTPWLFLSISFLLIVVRRTVTLIGWFAPEVEASFRGPVAELIALAVSLFMLGGVLTIPRVFEALRRLEAEIGQARRMEGLGRLAGGVAHDFNNLLTVVLCHAGGLLKRLGPQDPAREGLQEILRAGERGAALTRQLLAFGRRQVLQPVDLDLNAVVSDVVRMLRRLTAETIELTTVLEPALAPIRADRAQIEQILTNLVVNARDAMPGGGKLTLETANVDGSAARKGSGLRPGPYVSLRVTDTGCGMDERTRAHLFEPFFTTKEAGKGTGLGLATVYGIVAQSGGAIEVDSAPGRGTCFQIFLPALAGASPPPPPPEPAAAPVRGTETVLLAEDDERLRAIFRRVLEDLGYTVYEARSGSEALQIADLAEGRIDLLLTDLVMPHMSGRELAERLALARPEMRALYMSGYTDDTVIRSGALDPGVAFLAKPFAPAELAAKIRQVLGAPRSSDSEARTISRP